MDKSEEEITSLAWALDATQGQFKLFVARCNGSPRQLIYQLKKSVDNIRTLELQPEAEALYSRIRQEEMFSRPLDALMVTGFEAVKNLDQLLIVANQVREEFRNFCFPIVLWVNDEVFIKLMQLAPDLESIAITTEFTIDANERS